jgi:hypothetical protein
MQKIEFFGGWAREADVVLDFIDPTMLPSPGALQLCGWMIASTSIALPSAYVQCSYLSS